MYTDINVSRLCTCLFLLSLLSGCSHTFPRPEANAKLTSTPDGNTIFEKTFVAHGGDHLADLKSVNVGLDGQWKFLITRIQPLVTDHKYRVVSQERLLPNSGIYASFYRGPAGTKKVFRSATATRVFYNGKESLDGEVLASTALTADAFFIFILGPLALADFRGQFIRLQDRMENGTRYHRIYAQLKPGIGESAQDEIVLWVDPSSLLTHRVHITLEGYKTTQGAHVDVTFLNYTTRGDYTFASEFHERVRGPIAIDAHSWELTGIDINRDLSASDLNPAGWSEEANKDAHPLSTPAIVSTSQ